jgi:glycosyltransferase involved in cell wall biosynthesis
VTCMCLTRNRRAWLPKAIQCFLSQTYKVSQLLVVAEGPDVRDLVPRDPRIHLIHLSERTWSIGEKRNYACERATGDIICHWDDDDWSAPDRLADQLARLQQTGCAVTGYHSMRFTDGAHWWKYAGTKTYALGTSLCYHRSWWDAHRFQPKNVGEDNYFVEQACAAKTLASVDAGELMHATIHDANTSPRRIGSNWKSLSE